MKREEKNKWIFLTNHLHVHPYNSIDILFCGIRSLSSCNGFDWNIVCWRASEGESERFWLLQHNNFIDNFILFCIGALLHSYCVAPQFECGNVSCTIMHIKMIFAERSQFSRVTDDITTEIETDAGIESSSTIDSHHSIFWKCMTSQTVEMRFLWHSTDYRKASTWILVDNLWCERSTLLLIRGLTSIGEYKIGTISTMKISRNYSEIHSKIVSKNWSDSDYYDLTTWTKCCNNSQVSQLFANWIAE